MVKLFTTETADVLVVPVLKLVLLPGAIELLIDELDSTGEYVVVVVTVLRPLLDCTKTLVGEGVDAVNVVVEVLVWPPALLVDPPTELVTARGFEKVVVVVLVVPANLTELVLVVAGGAEKVVVVVLVFPAKLTELVLVVAGASEKVVVVVLVF